MPAVPEIADALTAELAIRIDGAAAQRVAEAAGLGAESAALLLPMRSRDPVLLLAGDAVRELSVGQIEAAAAILNAAGAHDAHGHAALARAARALNESLDLSRVLPRLCEEAAAIIRADAAAV